MKRITLRAQLIIVSLIAIIITCFSMLFVLPQALTPFYEKNIYQLLEEPIKYIKSNQLDVNTKTAFIILDDKTIIYSNNYEKIITDITPNNFVNYANANYGKIVTTSNTYYYRTGTLNDEKIILIRDDSYIKEQKSSFTSTIFPTIIMIFLFIISLLILYSEYISRKINKIKTKIDNIDNESFDHNFKFKLDDELNSLNNSIENTRKFIKQKEKYKNNMFQSISHELKTPIMVISSYIEAINDEVVEKDEALKVIKEETSILNDKVSSILTLNKINYLKGQTDKEIVDVYIKKIVDEIISKLKIVRSDVIFDIHIKKSTHYRGTINDWYVILNNILSNFIRYAKTKITVIAKNDCMILSNNGEKIEDELLPILFEPYKLGKKGKTGLGLAITKDLLNLFGYTITAKNTKIGVRFEIR